MRAGSEQAQEMMRFIDALRLWMGKRPLYKLDRNEGCLDWSQRWIGDGNRHINTAKAETRVSVRLGL